MFKEIKNAGDHRFPLRGGTRQWLRGRNKLSSSAELLAIALSVTVNRATSPEGRGFKKELLYDETEVFYTVGTDVLGCPKKTTAGASHPPYDRGQKCMTKLNYPIYTLLLVFN